MGTALVTKAEYKAYAGISSTNQDAAIDAIIPKVSDLVKNICGRTFIDYITTPKVEYFEGGFADYQPKEFPLIAITSLEYSLDYGATYTALTNYTDYVRSISDNTIKTVSGLPFTKRLNGYKLTYTAGYSTLPEDLKVAVLDLISYYLRNDMAVHSSKAPGTNSVQIEYVTTTSLPAHIRRVLDLYMSTYI